MTVDPTVIAAALVTVIAAVVTGTVTVINAIAAMSDRKEARSARQALSQTTLSTEKKADTLIEKAVQIHTVSNGTLGKAMAALDVALAKIAGLEQLVASLTTAKTVADALATAAAAGDRAAAAAPTLPVPVEVVNTPLTVETRKLRPQSVETRTRR